MPTWIVNLPLLFAIYVPASMVLWSIRLNQKLKSSLVLDWGPQTNRIRSWGTAVLIASPIWVLWSDSPDLGQISMWLWMGLFALESVLTTIPHQGIYEDGVFLMRKILWMAQGRFIRWSEILDYRWEERTRLIINPGQSPIICRISPVMLVDLKATLKEKCPGTDVPVLDARS